MTPTILRNFEPADAPSINALAVTAFEQYENAYDDWPTFRTRIANMSSLAGAGEIILAEQDNQIIGAVAYVGPGKEKAAFFQPEWPIMRMLVVAPQARGLGVGKSLAEACLARAQRDGANVFALHTSELMQVALPMYLRMGFTRHCAAPPIHGVSYDIYLKQLG